MEIADKWDKDYASAVKLQVLPETKKQINSDVLRTFSHSAAFSEGTGRLGRAILTRVLEAITVSTSFGVYLVDAPLGLTPVRLLPIHERYCRHLVVDLG